MLRTLPQINSPHKFRHYCQVASTTCLFLLFSPDNLCTRSDGYIVTVAAVTEKK